MFVCTPATTTDSHAYIAAAIERGATSVITHSEEAATIARRLGVEALAAPATRREFNQVVLDVSRRAFHDPAASMRMVGITGTNGKTTTAWLVRDLLSALGEPSAYIGTLGYQRPGREIELNNTTPFPSDFMELLADARDHGVKNFAAEVSSHALAERRVDPAMFEVAVFTNLTQDHLDFHKTLEAYEEAKFELFGVRGPSAKSVINIDDPAGRRFVSRLGGESVDRCLTFGTSGLLTTNDVRVHVDSIDFDIRIKSEIHHVHAPLGGAFNVENLTAAIGATLMLGHSLSTVCEAARVVRPVPGRFEPVVNPSGIGVVVDYAHTPDALIKVLDTARSLSTGRILTVFGCGGDRDRTKRPLMASAVSERSDVTIVTSDNPRTEDPERIIADVLPGVVSGAKFLSIIDRRAAIQKAIELARPGDVVVLAGKGHEEYQIIGTTKHPFSDRQVAREALDAIK